MISITGTISSALTHFAMVGLASILAEAGARGVRVRWRNGEPATAEVTWSGDHDAAPAVLDHAQRHLKPDSWVQAAMPDGEPGLFSPRFKPPSDTDGWAAVMAARQPYVATMSPLDCRLAGALGEPGYWLPAEMSPDAAASRWEMKTRNQGQHFMAHRLAPMAALLAQRDVDGVRGGLTGECLVDEAGKGKLNSRTSSGLTTPQPVDTALAWCGLWGLASMTLVPDALTYASSAGAWPRNRTHPRSLTLPVWSTPVSEPLWRCIVGSPQFDQACHGDDLKESGQDYLRRHGVAALVQFPVHVTDNPSAPERMLRSGTLTHLVGSDV